MAVWLPFQHPASFHVMEGSLRIEGAPNATTAAILFKMLGSSEVERQVLAEAKQMSAPTREALLRMSNPRVEFTDKGAPTESSPGSQVWSIRFLAYVRDVP
jgi:hypothetical protein